MTDATYERPRPEPEPCDVCGSERTEWRKCKLICLNCNAIVKSCSDL
jgi:hypothetical protein